MTNDYYKQWESNGYINVPGVIPEDECKPYLEICNRVLDSFLENNPESGEPGYVNGHSMRKIENS